MYHPEKIIHCYNVVCINLDTLTMYAEKHGESFQITQVDHDTFYYEHKNLETEEYIATNVCDVSYLEENEELPKIVNWMAKGYKGIPKEFRCVNSSGYLSSYLDHTGHTNFSKE